MKESNAGFNKLRKKSGNLQNNRRLCKNGAVDGYEIQFPKNVVTPVVLEKLGNLKTSDGGGPRGVLYPQPPFQLLVVSGATFAHRD